VTVKARPTSSLASADAAGETEALTRPHHLTAGAPMTTAEQLDRNKALARTFFERLEHYGPDAAFALSAYDGRWATPQGLRFTPRRRPRTSVG
jgi:hypothetical protein